MQTIGSDDRYLDNMELIDQRQNFLLYLLGDAYMNYAKRRSAEQLQAVLKVLVNYANFYFDSEEQLMRKFPYPEYSDHKVEHKRFIDRLDGIHKALCDGDIYYFAEKMSFQINWLNLHRLKFDVAFSQYLPVKSAPEDLQA